MTPANFPDFATCFVRALDRRVPVEGQGRKKTVPARQIVLENLLALALTGDPQALKRLLQYRPRTGEGRR